MNLRATDSQKNAPVRRAGLWSWTAFAAVFGLALFLRVFELDNQSITGMEVDILAHLDEPNFFEYMKGVQFNNPDHVPLMFFALYGWTRLFGDALLSVRTLAVLISMATFPLLYLFTARLYGRRAGILAMLMLALSPPFIHSAQSPRPTTLLVPLALLSVYALHCAGEHAGRRWWLLNFAANTLMLWTHLMSGFLLSTQFVYLVLARTRMRVTVKWLAANGVVALLALLWILPTFSNIPAAEHSVRDGYYMPGVVDTAYDLLGDDLLARMVVNTWFRLPDTPGFGQAFLYLEAALVYLGWALMGLLACGLLWGGWRVLQAIRGTRRGGAAPAFRAELLLILVAVMPLFQLVALCYAWRPVLARRYTHYSSLALYMLLAGAVTRIPWRPARWFSVMLIALLFGYQAFWCVNAVRRQDWRGLTREIQTNARPGDTIVIHDSPHIFDPTVPDHPFQYYFRGSALPQIIVPTLRKACDTAFELLSDAESDRSVWFLINTNVEYQPLIDGFQECLTSAGLTFEVAEYRGTWHQLYHIQRAADTPAAEGGPPPAPLPGGVDYSTVLERLGLAKLDRQMDGKIARMLYDYVEREEQLPKPGSPGIDLARLSLYAYSRGYAALAYALGKEAFEQDWEKPFLRGVADLGVEANESAPGGPAEVMVIFWSGGGAGYSPHHLSKDIYWEQAETPEDVCRLGAEFLRIWRDDAGPRRVWLVVLAPAAAGWNQGLLSPCLEATNLSADCERLDHPVPAVLCRIKDASPENFPHESPE